MIAHTKTILNRTIPHIYSTKTPIYQILNGKLRCSKCSVCSLSSRPHRAPGVKVWKRGTENHPRHLKSMQQPPRSYSYQPRVMPTSTQQASKTQTIRVNGSCDVLLQYTFSKPRNNEEKIMINPNQWVPITPRYATASFSDSR